MADKDSGVSAGVDPKPKKPKPDQQNAEAGMASYLELYSLATDSNLVNKLAVAVTVKAQAILDLASPNPAQVAWARTVLESPLQEARVALHYVLAKNVGLTVAQINSASDASIQAHVNAAVDKLIAGGV